MTYPYGRAVPLDGPRATITAEERDDYKRDVQVLLNRGGPMTDTIDALVQQALGRALAKAVKAHLLKEDA